MGLPGSTKHLDLLLLHSRQRGTVSTNFDLSYSDVLDVIGWEVEGCTLLHVLLHAGALAYSGLVGGDGRAVKIVVEVFRKADSPCRSDGPISTPALRAQSSCSLFGAWMMAFFGGSGCSVIGNGDRRLPIQAKRQHQKPVGFQLQTLAVAERTERLFGCGHVCGAAT